MKKYIFSIVAMLAVCAAFVACGSDDDDQQYSHSQAPSVEMQGTYTGTFTRIQSNDANAQPESAEGTIYLTPGENGYVANIKFLSTDLKIDVEKVANISFANDGAVFSNYKDASQIVGNISNNGQLSVSFALTIRITPRSSRPYNITFSGSKTNSTVAAGE
jgi:uncharacterized alpha/beta hydrolase family protein